MTARHLDWIGSAILDLEQTLANKNSDYKIDGEFSNFEYASQVSGIHPMDVMVVQLGIKLGRLKGLADQPFNESRLDTFKDLAGYAVILYAYAMSQEQDGAAGGSDKDPWLALAENRGA